MIDEILLQLWKEQCGSARRSVRDGLRRRTARDRSRAEGVAFMLLCLKDFLVGLPLPKAAKQQMETEC
jgi:hypothetical protein